MTQLDVRTKPGSNGSASRREWLGLAILVLPTLLLSLDVSVLYLAFPVLSAELGASANQQLWIMDIYSFTLAGLLITMGTLGDRIGRRRLLLIGAAAFGAASILAAYSASAETLILARALLGVAGATLMPSTLALIRNMFPNAKQMASAMGIWLSCFMGGMALGPLVGGVLLEHFWWGSAFLPGVPVMVLLLVAGPKLLPEYRDPQPGRLDLTSVGLSMAAILPIIYGMKELARDGWGLLPTLALVTGITFGWIFVHRQNHLADPLIDLRMLTSRVLSIGLTVMLIGWVVMAGISLMSILYLQAVQELSPLQAGLWLLPQSIAMIIGFNTAPLFEKRWHPIHACAAGLVLAAVGLGILTQVHTSQSLPTLIIGMSIASAGFALPLTLITNVVLASAPVHKAGSVAAISETSGEFGAALGIATMGSLCAVIYRHTLALPVELPDGAAENARESIAGALNTAETLPTDQAAQLIANAQQAFTTGLNATAAIGAGIFLVLAVTIASLLHATSRP